MKFFILCSVLLCASFLMSCAPLDQTYEVRTVGIPTEIATLKSDHIYVGKLLKQQQYKYHIFSKDEWRKILNLDAAIVVIIDKCDIMARESMATVNLEDVRFLWRVCGESYTSGREVVYNHWSAYSESNKVLLESFDRRALEISKEMNNN